MDDPGDGEHQWSRFYLEGELADVRCAKCHERPLDGVRTGHGPGECHGLIRAMIKGILG